MKLNWNFLGEGRVQNKKPSMGGVWIFPGTTQYHLTHIGKAANAFNKLLPIMHHKSIRLRTKMAIYQVAVISTLLYGAEAWNTTSQEEKRSAAFYTRCLRRILGVSWRNYNLKCRDFQKNWSGSPN